MSKLGFEDNVDAFKKALNLCGDVNPKTPFLVLLYSLIDAMANLCLPGGREQATSQDYEAWLDKYVKPYANLPCTSGEIYAARCGLSHTHAAESMRSRKGKARQIHYAWGDADVHRLQLAMDAAAGPGNVVAVRIEALEEAVLAGIQRMRDEMSADGHFAERVYRRAGKIFSHVPSDAI